MDLGPSPFKQSLIELILHHGRRRMSENISETEHPLGILDERTPD